MISLRGRKRTEFPQSVRKKAYQRCCFNGTMPGVPQCENCGTELNGHTGIIGGEPTLDNCKVYCVTCAVIKTETEDKPRMAKADRVAKKHYGLQKTKRPFPGSMASGWKKPMNGPAVRR